jgi:hypothetical protein
MWDKIIGFLSAPFFAFGAKIVDVFQRYFPPKTEEETKEGVRAEVKKKQDGFKDTGRPQ